MKSATSRIFALALLGLVVSACAPRDGATRYPLKGKIESLDILDREVTLAHEAIPEYMAAMTMPFKMPEATGIRARLGLSGLRLERLRRGDVITATLAVTANESWIENVQVVRYEPPPDIPIPPAKEARVGEPVRDVDLVDQDGKPLRLSDYRGRVPTLTFIYTRCPLPDFCPRTMKNFQILEQAIEDDPRLRDTARLLSISFDVDWDRPEVLNAYGSAFVQDRGQGPFARWKLATGTKEAIESLGRFLGLVFYQEGGQFTHTMVTIVIGPDGKLVRELHGSDWSTEEALQAMREAAVVKGS